MKNKTRVVDSTQIVNVYSSGGGKAVSSTSSSKAHGTPNSEGFFEDYFSSDMQDRCD